MAKSTWIGEIVSRQKGHSLPQLCNTTHANVVRREDTQE